MKKYIGWGIMTFLALTIALMVSRYFTLNPDVYFPEQRDVYLAHQTGILTHIVGGVMALSLGTFQFLASLRERRPLPASWPRWALLRWLSSG